MDHLGSIGGITWYGSIGGSNLLDQLVGSIDGNDWLDQLVGSIGNESIHIESLIINLLIKLAVSSYPNPRIHPVYNRGLSSPLGVNLGLSRGDHIQRLR